MHRRVTITTYSIALKLTIRPDIKQSARGVIRTSTEGVAVGEELNGIDIRVVCGERLDALLLADIPKLGKSVTGTRHELVVIERVDAQAHDVSEMVGKLVHL